MVTLVLVLIWAAHDKVQRMHFVHYYLTATSQATSEPRHFLPSRVKAGMVMMKP